MGLAHHKITWWAEPTLPSIYELKNFIQNANGSVSVSRAGFGTDILWDVDGFWFFGSEAWYSIADAIALTSSGPYVDENGVFTGTDGNDRMVGTAGEMDIFYGGMGNDQFIGGDDWYDQGEYDGELVEYTITQNANGTITRCRSNLRRASRCTSYRKKNQRTKCI